MKKKKLSGETIFQIVDVIVMCLFMVLVFLLNVLYQSEVSYTAHEVTTISGSLKFSLLVLVIWAVLIVAAAFVRGRFPVRSIEEKSCFAC